MTPIEIVQDEGRKFGREISEHGAEYVLWEETGYPCWWPDRTITPEENLRAQLREFFDADEKRRRESR